jgi:hypothetical protein
VVRSEALPHILEVQRLGSCRRWWWLIAFPMLRYSCPRLLEELLRRIVPTAFPHVVAPANSLSKLVNLRVCILEVF